MFIIITRTSFRPAFIFYVTRKLTLSLFLSNGDLFSKLCLDRDNDVLLQIDKDVRRLCPDLTFFQQVEEYWLSKRETIFFLTGNSSPTPTSRGRSRRRSASEGKTARKGHPGGQVLLCNMNWPLCSKARLQSQTLERKGVGPSTLANRLKENRWKCINI